MFVHHVTIPGSQVAHAADTDTDDINALLRTLQDSYVDALLALHLYEGVGERIAAGATSAAAQGKELAALYGQHRADVMKELGSPQNADEFVAQGLEIERRMGIAQFEKGIPPNFLIRLASLHARSFVYAFDSFKKAIDRLAKIKGSPHLIAELGELFSKLFPHVKDVRDTSHHLEDRVRCVDRNQKKIVFKPVDTPFLKSNGGFIGHHLSPDSYSTSTGSGSVGTVKITRDSVKKLGDLLQSAVQTYQWEGRPTLIP